MVIIYCTVLKPEHLITSNTDSYGEFLLVLSLIFLREKQYYILISYVVIVRVRVVLKRTVVSD